MLPCFLSTPDSPLSKEIQIPNLTQLKASVSLTKAEQLTDIFQANEKINSSNINRLFSQSIQ